MDPEAPADTPGAGHTVALGSKSGRISMLLPGNIMWNTAKSQDLWEHTQQHTLPTLGCASNATCPELVSCSQQKYVCTHNPLHLRAPQDFHMKVLLCGQARHVVVRGWLGKIGPPSAVGKGGLRCLMTPNPRWSVADSVASDQPAYRS